MLNFFKVKHKNPFLTFCTNLLSGILSGCYSLLLMNLGTGTQEPKHFATVIKTGFRVVIVN